MSLFSVLSVSLLPYQFCTINKYVFNYSAHRQQHKERTGCRRGGAMERWTEVIGSSLGHITHFHYVVNCI